MGAKHYLDHEIRLLAYSAIYNAGVRGENEALARQLHRSVGAINQEKGRIRRIINGTERDPQIERVLAGLLPKKRVQRKREPVKERRGILSRFFGIFK